MKRIQVKLMPYLFGIAVLTAMSACGGNENSDSAANGTDTSMGADNTKVGDKVSNSADTLASKINDIFGGSNNADSSFVLKAGTQNSDETKLLQAGISKGTSAELKAHAKMMLADHQKLATEMKAYAAKKKYSLMDSSESKAKDDLSDIDKNAKGKEWDKAWTDKLVDGHEKTVKLFENAQSRVKDPVLSAKIGKTLSTLRSHLTMVEGLQNSMK